MGSLTEGVVDASRVIASFGLAKPGFNLTQGENAITVARRRLVPVSAAPKAAELVLAKFGAAKPKVPSPRRVSEGDMGVDVKFAMYFCA